jgi:hypothetical protein
MVTAMCEGAAFTVEGALQMRYRMLWCVIPAFLAGAGIGCQESSSGKAAPSANVSSAAAPQLASAAPSVVTSKPRARFARHGGLASGVFHAARDLDLSPAQQDSLEKIETSLKSDDDGVRSAMKAFRADLVTGIRAGKLDAAKLTADDAVVDKAVAEHLSKEAEALDSLRALLDASQRIALVSSVRAKQAEHESHMTSWMSAREADGGAPDWTKRRLDKLTADLGLDAAQQKQASAVLAKSSDAPNAAAMQARWDERKKRSEAMLTAFAGDTFDAKKLDLGVLPGKSAHEALDHMAAFFTQLVPILHPDQRDKLATSMDRPFGAGGRPGPGGPAGGGGARGPADDIVFPFVEPAESAEPEARSAH